MGVGTGIGGIGRGEAAGDGVIVELGVSGRGGGVEAEGEEAGEADGAGVGGVEASLLPPLPPVLRWRRSIMRCACSSWRC